jgi:hypothetical protein
VSAAAAAIHRRAATAEDLVVSELFTSFQGQGPSGVAGDYAAVPSAWIGAGSVRRRSAGSVAEEIVELSSRRPSWESSASSAQRMRRPRHGSPDRAGLPTSPKSDDAPARACEKWRLR